LIIHNRSSANPENLAKIGPVHNWILRQLVWPESLKTNTKQKQNTLPAGLLSAAGRAKIVYCPSTAPMLMISFLEATYAAVHGESTGKMREN